VTVELAGLLARHGGPGGTGGWGGILPAETIRRLACDATVTRAVVHRHPTHPDATDDHPTTPIHAGHAGDAHHAGAAVSGHVTGQTSPATARALDTNQTDGVGGGHVTVGGASWPVAGGRASPDGGGTGDGGLAARLHRAMALLPVPLGAPTELLDLGRATRVISPALRRALAVRDGGCVADGCDRPASWADAHHLVHWLEGGATSLDNLVLLCRTHHRAVHEDGCQLNHHPTGGQHILTPPSRSHPSPAA
jgi:hypothetical protein